MSHLRSLALDDTEHTQYTVNVTDSLSWTHGLSMIVSPCQPMSAHVSIAMLSQHMSASQQIGYDDGDQDWVQRLSSISSSDRR